MAVSHDEKSVSLATKFSLAAMLLNITARPDFLSVRKGDTDMLSIRLCRALYKPFVMIWNVKGFDEANRLKNEFGNAVFELE